MKNSKRFRPWNALIESWRSVLNFKFSAAVCKCHGHFAWHCARLWTDTQDFTWNFDFHWRNSRFSLASLSLRMRCLWVTEFLCLSDDWAGPAKQTKPCSWMGHQLGKPAESSWLGSLSAWHRAIGWALELAMWSNQGCPRQPKRKTSRSTPRQRAILGDNSVGLLHNCQDHPHVQWICAK